MVSLARKETNRLGILLTGHGAGLGILPQIYSHSHVESNNDYNSNVVLKSGLRYLTTTPIITKYYSSILTPSSSSSSSSSSSVVRSYINVNDGDGDYSGLKSCHFCSKPLRSDRDIYMYRYVLASIHFI